jgi:hypothetical protein
MHFLVNSSKDKFNFTLFKVLWAGIAQSVLRLATSWKFRGTNPGGGEIFRTYRDRPWWSTQPPVQWVPGLYRG